MHHDTTRLGGELEYYRLRHREARLRLVVRRLEDRVADKRRHGQFVPLALRASLDDFRAELSRIQQLTAT
jgi:hypothetical protein